MERSLTVLLPVHDCQATLVDTVTQVLDAASDLTDRFQLLIIDDGSSDATAEIADELARHYPQVRSMRHAKPLGREAALQTGLAHCRGDVALLREGSRSTLERLDTASQPVGPNYRRSRRSAGSD
ncbi:MAG: glycosyltransferase [Thermoguttaceae bacterium]